MRGLLAAATAIDRLSRGAAILASAAVLAACLISAGVAVVRYGLSAGSNAFLEIQWYLFSATFLLGAAWTLKKNEHVRVDLVYSAVSDRGRLWIDAFGFALFLLPGMALMAWLGWAVFWESFVRHEISTDPGGLVRWPVKLLLPLGFALVFLQGCAELIRRIAALSGQDSIDTAYVRPDQ